MFNIFDVSSDYMFHFNIFHLISIILCFLILFNRNLYSKEVYFLLKYKLRYIVAFYCLLFYSFPIYWIFLLGNLFITIFCLSLSDFSYEVTDERHSKFTIYFSHGDWYGKSYLFSAVCTYLIAIYIHFCGVILDDSYTSYSDVDIPSILFISACFSVPMAAFIFCHSKRDEE